MTSPAATHAISTRANASRFPYAPAVACVIVAVALRLWFWAYTDRTWEDALITLQHAENGARGLGLTHAPGNGRPLHGFTSPISVLVPLAGEWAHQGWGLPLQKILSALFGGVSVWLGILIAYRLRVVPPLALLIGGYLAVEHHQILFGMAGMETQIVVAILLFSVWTLFDMRAWLVGLGLGLSLLARPDLILWVGIVVLLLGWHCWRRGTIRPLAEALAVLLLVYGPWVVWTTAYYGSPIPNTIVAKAYGYYRHWYAGLPLHELARQCVLRVAQLVLGNLGPAYGGNGTGYQNFGDKGLTVYAVLFFLLPAALSAWHRRDDVRISLLAFTAVYSAYYLFAMGYPFGWYTVPLAAMVLLACVVGLDWVLRQALDPPWRGRVAYALALIYLLPFVVLTPTLFRGEREVQKLVENGVRKQIGIYLGSIMRPDQVVGCEPLGYVGYYSRRVVYDYPGLCNRKVTQFMKEHPQNHELLDMLAFFRPDYVVLRPPEVTRALRGGYSWIKQEYVPVKTFRVPDDEARAMLFSAENIDKEFVVYRKAKPPPSN